MEKKLPGICFWGCGNIALKHAKILKKIFPDIELSFASGSSKKSIEYKQKFNGKNSFLSYEEAACSSLYNIAFITTPHSIHSKLAVLAAKNKKDIIIEKPVTRNIKELSEIEKAVKKYSVRCTIAENYMFKPFIKKLKEYIKKGIIGTPLFIELNKTNKDNLSGWRTDKEMMGGGALLEGGVHWVNALVSLADSPPVEVIALKPGINYNTNIPYEDSLIINVKFKNGIVGKLTHSWRIPNPMKGMGISKIYGNDGVVTFESNGLFFYIHGKKKKFYFTNIFDFLGFKTMHKSFIDSYIKGIQWEPSLTRIKEELKLIESAYRSINTKKLERI